MAIEAKVIAACIRRALARSVEAVLMVASHHPFLIGLSLSLLVLYTCFPFLFALLVSSSPVLVATTLLLGILLSYGEPNIPAAEGDETSREASSSRAGSAAAAVDLRAKSNERMVEEAAAVIGEARAMPASCSTEGTVKGIHDKGRGVPVQKEGKGQRTVGDTHGASTDSGATSTFPDGSVNGIVPVLDELHPLLDAEAPQPILKPLKDSDASQSGESDDESTSEEDEEEHYEEEDEETKEKDDDDQEAVKWTADDQKNLMELGKLEMERNQRLENLIARRSARRSLIPEFENNLIDLDVNDHVPNVDNTSRFQFQIPPISATRQNPFDIPYESEEAMGFPPVPGSAPSIAHPRKNPFDVPYDQADQSGSSAAGGLGHQEFIPISQHENPLFRRHESFTLGASFFGEFRREKRDTRIKPFFVPDKVEGAGFSPFQRQLSDKSETSASSVHESEMTSSVIDQEDHKELIEEGVHQDGELLSPADHDAEPADEESETSEEVDSVEADHEQSLTSVGAAWEINSNASLAEGTHQAIDAFPAVQVETGAEEYDFSVPDVAKLEVIEDKYDESSSSSSSEMNGISSEHRSRSANLDSTIPLSTDSTILSREKGDSSQVAADPVYDSSPSAAEKALAEDLFHAGGRGLDSRSSLTSVTNIDISEGSSPPNHIEKNILSGGDTESAEEDLMFASGGLWVASPSLSSVDETESRSREINEIRELDVIQVGLPVVHEDHVKPIKLVMQRFSGSRMIPPSILSSVGTGSGEGTQ